MQRRHIKYDRTKPPEQSRSVWATFVTVHLPMSYVTPALSMKHGATDKAISVVFLS